MTQTRWLCRTCEREWLDSQNACGARAWTPDDGCPGCHSAAIERVTYAPMFPGADIPRESQPNPVSSPPPMDVVVHAPPHTLTALDDTDALVAQWEALGR